MVFVVGIIARIQPLLLGMYTIVHAPCIHGDMAALSQSIRCAVATSAFCRAPLGEGIFDEPRRVLFGAGGRALAAGRNLGLLLAVFFVRFWRRRFFVLEMLHPTERADKGSVVGHRFATHSISSDDVTCTHTRTMGAQTRIKSPCDAGRCVQHAMRSLLPLSHSVTGRHTHTHSGVLQVLQVLQGDKDWGACAETHRASTTQRAHVEPRPKRLSPTHIHNNLTWGVMIV